MDKRATNKNTSDSKPLIDYVYRFRLYPSKEQKQFLNKQMGCVRFVYNEILERAKKEYEENKKKWNLYEYVKLLPSLKEEYQFLKEANSQSLQQAVFDRDENASDTLLKEGLRIVGQELSEFTPVEKGSVDDRMETCLKSAPSLKQEAAYLNER